MRKSTDFESFKFKPKIGGKAFLNGNTSDAEIGALLKYLKEFRRTL